MKKIVNFWSMHVRDLRGTDKGREAERLCLCLTRVKENRETETSGTHPSSYYMYLGQAVFCDKTLTFQARTGKEQDDQNQKKHVPNRYCRPREKKRRKT